MSGTTSRDARLGRNAIAVVLILAGLATARPSAAALAAQTTPLRRSFDIQAPVAPTPVPVAGSSWLVYELHLANFAREPLTVQRVEVVDAADGAVIANVHGDDLNVRLAIGGMASGVQPRSSAVDAQTDTIAPGVHAVLYLELLLDGGAPPGSLEHRVTYSGVDENAESPAVVRGARIPVSTEAPVALAPPLRGGPWAAVYHPSWERGHRRYLYAVAGRARIPGRFAIDFVKLDAAGRHAQGDNDEITNWYGYGADVLAVADGVVAAVRDDVAESATISGQPDLPLEDGAGNYITLDIGGGRFAFYEHLEPGSIGVRRGQRVTRGQVIGAVGFTGHSMGPHLHFHVADSNASLDAEGLPFVLEHFDMLGAYDGFDAMAGVGWKPLERESVRPRTGEMPAANAVIDFGRTPMD